MRVDFAELDGISVEFSFFRTAIPTEPDELVREFVGRILMPDADSDADEGVEIGTISVFEAAFDLLWLYPVGTVDEVLDAHSQDLAEYLPLLDHDGVSAKVRDQFGGPLGADLLIINSVVIKPEFRGHGAGLLAVNHVAETLGRDAALVVMRPFPIQFSGYQSPDWEPPEGVDVREREAAFRQAHFQLCSYWERLGFTQVRGTDIWARSPWVQHPSCKDILEELRGKKKRGRPKHRHATVR